MSEQRLFISHASEDAAVVNRIVAYLEAQGVPCWVSSRDIPPRAIYADAITEAMQACSACAVVVSKEANQSKGVKRELELASHYDKPFIPIRVDDAEPAAGVDYYLRNTQWVDFKRDGNAALDRIAAQVKGAPLPLAPPPPPSRPGIQPMMFAGIAAVLIGVAGWYLSTRPSTSTATVSEVSVNAETLAPLLGSYAWDGVACGRGPTITLENRTLVFTMPDTPTFRHEVLSVTTASEGPYSLRVETRVTAPSESAGQSYALGLSGEELMLSTDTRDDVWTRCER